VLAEIGRALAAQLGPVTVRVPAELAAKAMSAWSRDEEEPVWPETAEQTVLRSFAAALALIGLAVEQAPGDAKGDVLVSLTPHQIAGCLFAAEQVEQGWCVHDSGP
jgi:hypothetical protein